MDGRPFIAMEYLEGQTLRARLGGRALPRRKALEYAIQIAHGLAAAHQKGIVHRDLKPENLWVTSEGRIKILDFGLAKFSEPPTRPEPSLASTATEPGRVMGTVGYMSPEQVRGQPLDYRTDIFSFGAILYEMLAGSRAFQGSSAIDTLIAILNTEPPELADPATNRLVRRCLEKDPARRFSSASDLSSISKRRSRCGLQKERFEARPLPRRRILQAAGGAASLAALAAGWELLPARWRNRLPGSSTARITRLAVLPLANLSGDVEQEAFADGMTDLLITDLGQIGALRVISRPSVMQFKGHEKAAARNRQAVGSRSRSRGQRAVVRQSGAHHGAISRSGHRSANMGPGLRA